MSYATTTALIKRMTLDLTVRGYVVENQVQRVYLVDEKRDELIAEAIGDKSVAEAMKDPAAWARRKLARRRQAIETHVARLQRQIDELEEEYNRLARFEVLALKKGNP